MEKPQCGYSNSQKARIYYINHISAQGLCFNTLHNCPLFIKWAVCIFACRRWCPKILVEPQMHKKHIRSKCMPGKCSCVWLLPFILWIKTAICLSYKCRWEEGKFWRLFSPRVMRTVHQLSHFSGMDVNVTWFPLAQDLGFHVWTNKPSIIFPPDWKKINFSWFVVLFLIADVCSVSVQIITLNQGILRGKSRMSR